MGTGAREGGGPLERVEIFQMRWIARRFTPVCRSRCGAGGADRGPGAGRFVRNLAHRPLRVILLVQANRKDTLARNLAQAAESTGSGMGCPRRRAPGPGRAGDRSSASRSSTCARSRADSRRSVEVDVARAGRAAPAADPGLLGTWHTAPCVWFCLYRPIERALSLGTWHRRRRARSECECESELVRECECGCACYCECACECDGDR